MEKEKWTADILSSLYGVQRAEPNSFLFTRIEARLGTATKLSTSQVRLAGVLVMVLLAINIWAALRSPTASNSTPVLTTIKAY